MCHTGSSPRASALAVGLELSLPDWLSLSYFSVWDLGFTVTSLVFHPNQSTSSTSCHLTLILTPLPPLIISTLGEPGSLLSPSVLYLQWVSIWLNDLIHEKLFNLYSEMIGCNLGYSWRGGFGVLEGGTLDTMYYFTLVKEDMTETDCGVLFYSRHRHVQ